MWESQIEVLARHLLLLKVAQDWELPIRQRANALLEIFGNCSVQVKFSCRVSRKGLRSARAHLVIEMYSLGKRSFASGVGFLGFSAPDQQLRSGTCMSRKRRIAQRVTSLALGTSLSICSSRQRTWLTTWISRCSSAERETSLKKFSNRGPVTCRATVSVSTTSDVKGAVSKEMTVVLACLTFLSVLVK